MSRCRALPAAVIVIGMLAGPCWASDPLGTVGRFKSFGAKNCGAPIMEQMKGACDPPAPSADLPAAERARANLKRAIELVSFLRLEAADAAVNDALKDDPRYVEALVFRVRLAMSQMAGDAVSRDLNAALLVAPDNPYLVATRAERELEMGDVPAALRDIAAALQQHPDDSDMLWVRARIRMELDQLDDAGRDLDRAFEIDPADRRILLFRAQLQLRRGEFDSAIADASALLRDHPGDMSALQARALAHTAKGQNSEAVDDLTVLLGKPGEPITASPQFAHFSEMFVQRAILLRRLDRSDEAGRDIDTIVRFGGKRALLRLQIFLRRNGFADLPLDGERSAALDKALEACFLNQACGRGLVRSL